MTSDIEFIKIEKLKDMSAMQTGILTLILEPENPGHFNGTLNISYIQNETQHILEIPLSIFVLTEGTSPENFQVQNETCEELSGKVCPQETLCNGTATFTKNTNPEYCCLDSCVEIENKSSDSSNFKWLAGIVILAILVLVGLYFYNKQKRVTPQKPREQIRVKTEKYNKRMKGILTKS